MSLKEAQQYRSWVEVDLDGFTRNIKEVKRLIGPHVQILQVVKADAYGHGAIEIANISQKNGVCCLGVANADEGVQLRVGGITAPIVILSPSTAAEIAEIIKYNLTPSVSDLTFARRLQILCKKADVTIRVHIEVDTGMGRGGRMNHETMGMIRKIREYPNLSIEGIFTHLSQSEIRTHHANENQWLLFRELLDELEQNNIAIPLRHMANSGAILNFPDFHLDMVRPGLMTYGIYPSAETISKANLTPVMSFKTRIILIKKFPAGYSIGYGGSFITSKPSRIATIPVGYGDGYSFILSNEGEALIRGKRSPVVGRISMDMCTLDVSRIPDCRVGDDVVLMGRQGDEVISADDLAAKLNTISYEILCALGKRAPRIFLNRGKKDTMEPRLRRIFIPDEEKSIARIDNIIRRCFHTRAHNVELGDAVYYTMFETLFGKNDRQLELRNNFKYHISMEEFPREEGHNASFTNNYFNVTTHVEYYKALKNHIFLIGCAENNEQLALLFEEKLCEYRWLLNNGDDLQAARDFHIESICIDNEYIPIIKAETTKRGYELWCGGNQLKNKINKNVKVEINIVTKKAKKSNNFSVYLIYPIRGLEITFSYEGANLKNVREIDFFAGKHPYPTIEKKKGIITLNVAESEWIFPNSGVTFVWDS